MIEVLEIVSCHGHKVSGIQHQTNVLLDLWRLKSCSTTIELWNVLSSHVVINLIQEPTRVSIHQRLQEPQDQITLCIIDPTLDRD